MPRQVFWNLLLHQAPPPDAEAPDPAAFILGYHEYIFKSRPSTVLLKVKQIISCRWDQVGHSWQDVSIVSTDAVTERVVAQHVLLPKSHLWGKRLSLWHWTFNEKFDRKSDARLVHVSTHACHEPGTSPSTVIKHLHVSTAPPHYPGPIRTRQRFCGRCSNFWIKRISSVSEYRCEVTPAGNSESF